MMQRDKQQKIQDLNDTYILRLEDRIQKLKTNIRVLEFNLNLKDKDLNSLEDFIDRYVNEENIRLEDKEILNYCQHNVFMRKSGYEKDETD